MSPAPSSGLALARRHPANLNASPANLTELAELPVGVLLDALADRLAERLVARAAIPQHPEHAGAKHNPLGTARAFLDAGRRGDFPTFKRGREVVARWVDVLAYIERRTLERKPRSAPKSASERPAPECSPARTERDENLEILREMGVLPRK